MGHQKWYVFNVSTHMTKINIAYVQHFQIDQLM